MAGTKQYQLAIADKRHNPLSTNPKHATSPNFHVGNLRLMKGQWHTVNEWWYLKNQALIKKYLDQGQIVVKCPDGSVLGQGVAAPSLPPEAMAIPVLVEPTPTVKAEVPAPAPESLEYPTEYPTEKSEEPAPPELLVKKDDLSVLPLKENKLKKLQTMAETFAQVVSMDVSGLVEQLNISPAQAEKVLAAAQSRLGG